MMSLKRSRWRLKWRKLSNELYIAAATFCSSNCLLLVLYVHASVYIPADSYSSTIHTAVPSEKWLPPNHDTAFLLDCRCIYRLQSNKLTTTYIPEEHRPIHINRLRKIPRATKLFFFCIRHWCGGRRSPNFDHYPCTTCISHHTIQLLFFCNKSNRDITTQLSWHTKHHHDYYSRERDATERFIVLIDNTMTYSRSVER